MVLFSSAAFFARPLHETARLVAESGYEGLEVMVTKDPESQDAERIRSIGLEFGVEIGAIHAPSLLLTRKVWGTDPVGKIDRSIDVAQRAGIPLVVMHPPFRWQRGYRTWLEERLPDIEARTGVTVAIENMFPVRLAGRDVTFHANQDLDELEGLPHLVLDTSHAAVARHDPIEVRRRFGDRLRHVHLSDNAGKGWDSHLPPGRWRSRHGRVPGRPGQQRLPGRRHAGGRPAALPHGRRPAPRRDGGDAGTVRAATLGRGLNRRC